MIYNISTEKYGNSYSVKLKEIEDICFSEPWSLNSLDSLLSDNNAVVLIYVLNEKIAGFVLGRKSFDECELYRIAVLPENRKQGIGNALLNAFCEKCAEFKIKSVFLEVAKNNNTAVLMYQRFDFQTIAVRKNYYGNDDGLVMRKLI